eukprot:gene202-4448_t
MDEYPDVFTKPPVPVVSLVMLKELHGDITKSIQNTCPLPIKILSFPTEESFTKKKIKQDINLQGIFKRSWMDKYQSVIPSVAMVLVEWKLEEDWKKQELSIIGIIERVKESFKGRNIKIMTFIVVEEEPRDKGENKIDDFVSNIKKICQIDSKSVNFIDKKDLYLGQSVSSDVSKTIVSLSINFYKENIARIKKGKNENEIITFRNKFKISFFQEILGNSTKVQKFLQQGYEILIEIQNLNQFSDNEIRTLSDYINLKLCLLKISEKKVDLAIKQFLDHIKWYKTLKGEPELLFEHQALISRQYRVFGEHLERVVLNNQSSYGNPGFYFQSAAIYSKNRKKWSKRTIDTFKSKNKIPENLNTYIEEKYILNGFIGQRKNGSNEEYFKIILNESKINHSEDIIKMLTKSYDHYFKRNQKRMIYYIASMIANEHFSSSNWLKAKKFYERILKEYRFEKWDLPLIQILKSIMICTKHLNESNEYIQYSIQLISELNQSNQIIYNQTNHQSNQLNLNQQQLKDESLDILTQLFKFLNQKDNILKQPLLIDSNHSILSLKVQFENPFISVFDPILFCLKFDLNSPIPIEFSNLKISFSDKQYDIIKPETFILSNKKSNEFKFEISIKEKMDLKCLDVSIELYGNEIKSLMDSKELFLQKKQKKLQQLKHLKQDGVDTIGNGSGSGGGDSIGIGGIDEHIDGDSIGIDNDSNVISGISDDSTTENDTLIIKENKNYVIFKWIMNENEYYSQILNDYDFRNEIGQGLFVERPVIRVNQPIPNLKLTFEHLPPALLNEFYGIKIILNSNQDSIINGKIKFQKIDELLIFNFEKERINEINFDEIKNQEKKEINIFMKSNLKGQHKIGFNIEYQTTKFPNLIKDQYLDIYTDVPFSSLFQYISTRRKVIESKSDQDGSIGDGGVTSGQDGSSGDGDIGDGGNDLISSISMNSELYLLPFFTKSFLHKTTTKSESFLELKNDLKNKDLKFIQQDSFPKNDLILLSTKLTCKTPFELKIKSSKLNLNSNFKFQNKPMNLTFDKSIKNLDHFTIVDLIRPNLLNLDFNDSNLNLQLGTIQIKYERVKNLFHQNLDEIELEIPLPSIKILDQKSLVSFSCPDKIIFGKPFYLKIFLENQNFLPEEYILNVKDSDNFYLSGSTFISFSILPFSKKEFHYCLIPKNTGTLLLPKFVISAKSSTSLLLYDEEEWSVFIHPN